jgi:hypothetical protein
VIAGSERIFPVRRLARTAWRRGSMLLIAGLGLFLVVGLWVAYGMLVGVRGARVRRRQAGELALLLVGPLVIAAWATIASGWASGPRPTKWAFPILNALAVASIALSVYVWRRHEEIAPFSAPAAVASAFATALARFVGTMAIFNDWL